MKILLTLFSFVCLLMSVVSFMAFIIAPSWLLIVLGFGSVGSAVHLLECSAEV